FVLSAFFGAQSGVGALGIDESDDWQPETIGQFEHATGLAIAFRPRTAEVALDTIRGALAALMPHDGDLMLAEVAEPRHDRAVIGEAPIAVKLDEVADQRINVIERLRAERIARQPHALDRAEALAGGGSAHRGGRGSVRARFQTILQACSSHGRAKNSASNLSACSAGPGGSSQTISGSARNHVIWRFARRRESRLASSIAFSSRISPRRCAAICL